MGRISRIIFVSFPFLLTVASLISLLIVTVPNDDEYIVKLSTKNLSISADQLESDLGINTKRGWGDVSSLTRAGLTEEIEDALADAAVDGTNITATDLGLADYYTLTLWNYCATLDGTRNCTTPIFNYVPAAVNASGIDANADAANFTIPKAVTDAIDTYGLLNEVTEIMYIIALIALVVELIFGVFALFSRVGSCCTWIVNGISTFIVIIASVLSTAMASVVVGAFDSVGKLYGLHASINTNYLVATWVGVAFSVAAGVFWGFSSCCCAGGDGKSSRHGRKKHADDDAEKLMPANGAYQRVQEPSYVTGHYAGQQTGIYENTDYGHAQGDYGMSHQSEYGRPGNNKAARNTAGYEPYSHAAI